jgi:hypothetical protein
MDPGRAQGEITIDFRNAAPLTPTSKAGSPDDALHESSFDASLDAALNLDHMELLIHVTQDRAMFSLGSGVESHHTSDLAIGLKEALKAPYLMHELLAYSAQHLAFLHPERSSHYVHQAMSLQTRAISLFNATRTDVNESNCVAILLFSSVVGHHQLADTLSKREAGGLETFVTHYVQCVEMARGLYTIAGSAWPLLMQSEIEPILTRSVAFTSQQPVGHGCDHVKDLVAASSALSQAEKAACMETIRLLQVGLDAVSATDELFVNRHQMIFSFTMLVPPETSALLAKKQPEALVLLAYYAVLLHHGRDLWHCQDVGVYLFSLIDEYLGPDWDQWMQYPRQEIIGG